MGLNIPPLTELVVWLEAGAKYEDNNGFEFNMNEWLEVRAQPGGHWCGTSCCIAGAALQFGDPELLNTLVAERVSPDIVTSRYVTIGNRSNVPQLAGQLLGLDEDEADKLFMPWDYYPDTYDETITPDKAALVIRNLIQTGEVDWTVAYPDWVEKDECA